MRGMLPSTGKPWNFKNESPSRRKTKSIFRNMHTRCSNPKAINWKYYGGAGIAVCPEWLTFDVFLSDMGDAPDDCQLDRIDPYGPYCKSNCRWVSPEQQNSTARTRRRFISVEEEHRIRSAAQKKALKNTRYYAATTGKLLRFWKGKKRKGLRGKLK